MTVYRQPLKGLRILVTRPSLQAGPLCRMLEHSGAEALRFPTLEIFRPQNVEPALEQIRRVHRFDWVVFISVNSVKFTQKAYSAALKIPGKTKIAAIGRATAAALSDAGFNINLLPEPPFNSEALLKTKEMENVAGCHILIIKGEGGRNLLADSLRRRGAEVCCAEVYRRRRPRIDPSSLIESWHNKAIDWVIVTSGEGLDNLVLMVGEKGWVFLRQTPMVVISSRLRSKALDMGIEKVLMAPEASDEGIYRLLAELYSL